MRGCPHPQGFGLRCSCCERAEEEYGEVLFVVAGLALFAGLALGAAMCAVIMSM